MTLTPTDFLGLTALGGIVAGLWTHLKTIWSMLRSIVMVKYTLDDATMTGLYAILLDRYESKKLGDKIIGSRVEFVRPVKSSIFVASYLLNESPTIFWNKIFPLIITSKGSGYDYRFTLFYIRGTWNITELIREAMDFKNNEQSEEAKAKAHRFNIFTKIGKLGKQQQLNIGMARGGASGSEDAGRAPVYNEADYAVSQPLHWKKSDIGYLYEPNPFRAYDTNQVTREAIEDAKKWIKSKNWYADKEIPWRRGWLLFGLPGTGKSKLASCIAQELDIPIYVFDIATMNNEDFTGFWNDAVGNSPSIVLLEDFDATFKGRVNKIKGGVTFDCILNCIGGVKDSNGVFTIITTNNLHEVDPALGIETDHGSSRPGRMDKVIKLGPMDEECRTSMAKRICSDYPELIGDLIKSSEGYTPAQFQELCTQVALSKYWKEHK